jgi:FixJ family two-component response regulator
MRGRPGGANVLIAFVADDDREVREATRNLLSSRRLRLEMLKRAMGRLLRNQCPGGPVSKCDARVIAVVDDHEGFRDALQLFLRTFGFQVEAFASGREFLRSSRLEAVGCVILDLAMPDMNGLEVQQQLAARGRQIPIVFVTAHRDDYLGQCASATGALAVLRKPADDEELVRLVREALGGQ